MLLLCYNCILDGNSWSTCICLVSRRPLLNTLQIRVSHKVTLQLHKHLNVLKPWAARGAGARQWGQRSLSFRTQPWTDSSGVGRFAASVWFRRLVAFEARFGPSAVAAALWVPSEAAAPTGREFSLVACPNEVNSVAPVRISECVYIKVEK